MACPHTADISEKIIAHEKFVLRIPDGLDLKGAGPLLCAGITTWSPLRHWKAGEGTNVGVIGLGGLGHMALKLAKGFRKCHAVYTFTWKRAGCASPRCRQCGNLY